MDRIEPTAAGAESNWASAQMGSSHHHGFNSLYSGDRLPMARFAERLSAIHVSSVLLLRLARPQRLAQNQSNAGRAHAPSGGSQAHSLGWRHRQPEREDHRKWRSMRV